MSAEKSIFQKIIDRELPADILYEDDLVIAIKDINPQAPIHLLIVPKRKIAKIADTSLADITLLGHMIGTARTLMQQQNMDDYRLVFNNGEKAGQTVFHIHLHVLAGRSFSWPLG